MALTLKGPLGSVSSSGMHRSGGVRDLTQAPEPHVTSDLAAVLILAKRERDADVRPPTQRVLMRNVLEKLHEAGGLPEMSARAGLEISRVWHFRTASLLPRTARYGESLARGPSGDEVSPGMVAACARFNIWAEWAAMQPVNPVITLVDLTFDVAVDGMGIRQVADHRRCDQRRALRLLQLSLWHYADFAGWHDEKENARVA